MNKKHKQMERDFMKEKAYNSLATPGAHDLIMVLDSLKPDFNIGKIFRTSDAFGVREIHLINTPFFSTEPSMGSFRHVPAKFFSEFKESYEFLKNEGYQIFVFEPGDHPLLTKFELPKKCALVFGHEQFGISFKKEDFEGVRALTIPQWGKVQSLNVSIAASVSMYEYIRQHSTDQVFRFGAQELDPTNPRPLN